MPKEITHWFIAQESIKIMDDDLKLKKILNKYKNLYFLSCMIPDTPAYIFLGKEKRLTKSLSSGFHNTSDNSYNPIINLIRESEKISEPLIAFISGIINHINVDRIFHPFVYYYSGRNIARHFEIEAYIDLFYLKEKKYNNRIYISDFIKNLEVEDKVICKFLLRLFGLPDNRIKLAKKGLVFHSRLQHSFDKIYLRRILMFLNIFSLFKLQPYISLFYPKVKDKTKLFFGKYKYFNPVSGVERQQKIVSLENKAKKEILKIFLLLERNINSKKDLISEFLKLKGPNLNTNLYGKTKDKMKYFDTSKKVKDLFIYN